MSVFINPYTDFGFKKLFGEEANRALLIDFLNSLLPMHHQIAEVAFQNVEQLADSSEERKAFFDIHCISLTGERFIVEMQKAKVKYFKDRSLYYITYPIREQAQKRTSWDFHLSPIYFVAVLDFLYEDIKDAKFLRQVVLKDQYNDLFYEKLQLTFLQMQAFTKTESELVTKLDKWAYFLKNLESFDHMPQIFNEPVFQQAFDTAKFAKLSPDEQLEYDQSRLQYIGAREMVNTAIEDGVLKGMAIANAEAELKIEQLRKEAEAKELQTILNFHKLGIPAESIAAAVSKSIEEVNSIITNSR
jgi:predicted transposase/invertase (TIGR01784 family)